MLTTERLVLQRFTIGDLDAYYDYQRLAETARHLYGEARSYAQCTAGIGRYVEEPFNGPAGWTSFTVKRQATPGLIGVLALTWNSGGEPEGPQPERFGEIGWTMAPAAQGQGCATEAAKAVLELSLDTFDCRRGEAPLDARNTASAAICGD